MHLQLYLVSLIYVYDETAAENRTLVNRFTWYLGFFKKLA